MYDPLKDPLELMRAGCEYVFEVRLRGFSVKLRPLSTIEVTQVAIDTHKELQAKTEVARAPLVESTIYVIKMLSLASSSGPGRTDYQLHQKTLENLTPDELQYLHREYERVCARVNPMLEDLASQEVEELVAQAKKQPACVIDFTFLQLVNVCRHFAEKESTTLTAN